MHFSIGFVSPAKLIFVFPINKVSRGSESNPERYSNESFTKTTRPPQRPSVKCEAKATRGKHTLTTFM